MKRSRWQNVKLIAFDLDGTVLQLINEEERIPEEAAALMMRFAEQGGYLACASGRGPTTQEAIFARSGLGAERGVPHFIIAYDKFIHTLEDGKYLPLMWWNQPVEKVWAQILPAIMKRWKQIESSLLSHRLNFELVGGLEFWREAGYVAMLFEDVERALVAMDVLQCVLHDIPGISINRNGRSAGATCAEFGKGQALQAVAESLGLSSEMVLAVGDSHNDLSMLDGRFGFLAATPSNGETLIKDAIARHGGYVATKPVSEGFCEIMKMVLGQV